MNTGSHRAIFSTFFAFVVTKKGKTKGKDFMSGYSGLAIHGTKE
jgi:hypothetical protein